MIERFLDSFSKISLNDMESTRLMNRIDFKYMFRKDDLGDVLTQLQPYYHVLRRSSKTDFRYDTLYFDTPERLFYHQHLHGKLNRYKVRARRYVDTDAQFLEVKLKDNKRRTIKKRIAIEELSLDLCPTSTDFLDNIADDFSAMALEPTVWVYYHRFTLVNKTCPERVTFDLNMWFRWQDQSGIYPHIVVAEAKGAWQPEVLLPLALLLMGTALLGAVLPLASLLRRPPALLFGVHEDCALPLPEIERDPAAGRSLVCFAPPGS